MAKPLKPQKQPDADVPITTDDAPTTPASLVWQCSVCGGLTDLVVCPIDGNQAP